MFLYTIFSILQWLNPVIDPQDIHYKWDNWAGIILLILNVLIWLHFLITLTLSLLNEAQLEKKYFLALFAAIFSIYFTYLPFIVMVAIGVPNYNRWKVVLGVTLGMTLIIYSVMIFLMWPSRHSKLFKLDSSRLMDKIYEEQEDESTPFGSL